MTQEEILRTDLSEVVLRMCDLRIYDFEHFPFITQPDKKAILSGEKTLLMLGAIDEQRHLTSIGEMMVKYPLLPRHSRCIYEAIVKYPEVIKNVIVCVSFLSCKTPFILPADEEDLARNAHRKFSNEFGDFIGYQFLLKRYNELKNRLTEIEVQCYLIQIIKALKYIHSHKIIHRDLKLGNLFLTQKMELKLMFLALIIALLA